MHDKTVERMNGVVWSTLSKLGYDSSGLKSFLAIMEKSQPGTDSVFLSAHISTGDSSGNSKPVFSAEFKQATQGKI